MDILKVVLTSFLSAGALFIIAKFMGHKQLAQLGFFDYITGITIGSIAAELATELEEPLHPLVAMIVYGMIGLCLSIISDKFPKSRKFINGTPTIVMDNGKLYRKNMKKAKLDLSEFMVLCRQAGYFNLSDIKTAVFENNGQLTILPIATKRPVTPEDMKLVPEPQSITTEIIMDGQILNENLQRMGIDATWLKNQLKIQGYNSAKEIYLGLCDKDKKVMLYAME